MLNTCNDTRHIRAVVVYQMGYGCPLCSALDTIASKDDRVSMLEAQYDSIAHDLSTIRANESHEAAVAKSR